MDMTLRIPILRQLLFRDLYINRKSTLIMAGTVTGLLTLFGVMAKMDSEPTTAGFHLTWYGIFFLIIGLFHTGGAFNEFAQPATRQDYLLLPASHIEKWSARWLRTLPFYMLSFTLVYWLASWIMNLVCWLAFGEIHSVFQPFQEQIWDFWKIYIMAHAVFLIGAIHFNKAATIKTALTLLVLQTAISFIVGIAAWMIFRSWSVDESMINPSFGFNFSEQMDFLLGKVGQLILWLILVPFFWWISFLKLTEKEV